MSKKQKRALKDENRSFNEEWELQYFLINLKDKMICLLCGVVINTIKKYNANQHYMTHSNHKYAILKGEPRKTILQHLKNEKLQQQQTLNMFFKQNNNATEATYRVAYILGKRGKPFSDVEMIKECIVEVVKCLHPEKVDKYQQLPLSRRTITDRQHELATNVTEQFCKIIKEENIYFSIALDESTDNIDSAQVLFFIRAITENFQCFEELLALGTLKDRTRGIDILESFKIKICEAELNINNLVSVCTDGAPAMIGKRTGFISLLKKDYTNLENLISFHCILHQQNLCAKSASLDDTLEKIFGIVNFIRLSSMRHRQFRDIVISDNETFNGDLPYHSKVRWLSRGQVLLKIFILRKQIIKFFDENNKFCDLSDKEFCRNAAFLCDIIMKQNELNQSLQGKCKYIYDMWQKIQAFRKKLVFFKTLLSRLEISTEHFPQLSEIMMEHNYSPQNLDVYISILNNIIEEYNTRFTDFEKHILTLKLTFEPHLVNIDEAPEEFQMELFEIGEDNILKSKFDSKLDPIEIWKTAVIYPRLRQHARRILSCFGSTYCCEATFSYLSQIKTRLRNQISDIHLEDQLKLRTTSIEPNISFLSANKQMQNSH